MPLAILLVLILIAVLIAPWLIGVAIAAAIAAAALYGTYLVAAAVIAIAALVVAVAWVLITGNSRQEKPEEIHGERKACKYCQVEMAASASRCGSCGKSSP